MSSLGHTMEAYDREMLRQKSLKELRSMCKDMAADISSCLEKSDIVDLLINQMPVRHDETRLFGAEFDPPGCWVAFEERCRAFARRTYAAKVRLWAISLQPKRRKESEALTDPLRQLPQTFALSIET